MAQFSATDQGRPARKGRAGRLLDVHLHQLAPDTPLCPRVGREIKEQGLVVIGVHTPEFRFEKDVDNVRRAVKDRKIDFPIAIDNDYAIWRAFDNHYWPALYIIDAQGRIRHHQFGEGGYEKAERIIQQLLGEAMSSGIGDQLAAVDARGVEAEADWTDLKSPENYLGHERTENFVSPGEAALDKRRVYAAPARLKLNDWALSGDWTVKRDAVALNKANGRLAYRFHARDLSSGHGAGGARSIRTISRPHRWTAAGPRSRKRCRRRRQRHGFRAAAVSIDPTTETHR